MSMRNLGGRPKKLDIKLTAESLEGALKNVWNEVEEIKLKAIQQYNKQIRDVSNNTDISMVGKTNADYLKIAGDMSAKKLEVAKVIQTYIQKESKGNDNSSENSKAMLSEDEKAEFAEMMSAALAINSEETPVDDTLSLTEIEEHEKNELDKIIKGEDISDEDITEAGF